MILNLRMAIGVKFHVVLLLSKALEKCIFLDLNGIMQGAITVHSKICRYLAFRVKGVSLNGSRSCVTGRNWIVLVLPSPCTF